MTRILAVVGTRPEAIKMAPVVQELRRCGRDVEPVVCVTGQHREMLDDALRLFSIEPDLDLDVMRPDQALAELTAGLFRGIDEAIAETTPLWVLAQGDTTTAMVAAVSAFYRGVAFAHVEAGLRTGDMRSPFPEEMNRRVADMVADELFAPTDRAQAALLKEGVPADRVHVTGNTVVDALLEVADSPYSWESGPFADVPLHERLVLVTAHRRESFGGPFVEICAGIRELAERFARDGVHFVYPVHLNPNVRMPVHEMLSDIGNLTLTGPVDYLSFVQLMKRCHLILTDSGGVQEEAPAFGVPVLVMRNKTERPEGIDAGVARLVGTEKERIVAEATRLLTDPDAHAAMAQAGNPYGDGKAAARIVSILLGRGTP